MKTLFGRLASLVSGTRATDAAPHPAPAPAPPAFEPQNLLERALMIAANDPEKRADFEKRLLETDIFVATPDIGEEGERTLETDETVRIVNIEGPDGPIPAVFTSEERLAAFFGAGTGYLGMKGEDLFGIIAASGAILNPGASYGVHWTPDALSALIGKTVRRTIEKDTKILLGTPTDRPEDLIARLSAAILPDARIEQAWLALAVWPEDETRTWYLDIRTHAHPDEVVPSINDALKEGSYGFAVDIIINAPGSGGTGIRIKPAQLH